MPEDSTSRHHSLGTSTVGVATVAQNLIEALEGSWAIWADLSYREDFPVCWPYASTISPDAKDCPFHFAFRRCGAACSASCLIA